MKARSYREFLTRKRVAIGILSFLTFFMTGCGDGSDFVGEVPPASDSDFINAAPPPADSDPISEVSPPADEHAPSQERPLRSRRAKYCDTSHCDLVPQEINGDGILAIGDSITAYYSEKAFGCCQSYSDYASIPIDEYIQNDAVSGSRLSGGRHPKSNIPQQYANAKKVNRGPYDVVILTGGGNDLANECLVRNRRCTESCADEMEEIVENMEALVTEIVNDDSDVIIVGYYKYNRRNIWASHAAKYNECVPELASKYQEIADSSSRVSFVDITDLADPYRGSDYAPDGMHPSITLAQKIGERVADAF